MSKQFIVYIGGSCLKDKINGGVGIFGYTYVELERAKNFRYPIKTNIIFTTKGMGDNSEKDEIEVIDVIECVLAVRDSKITTNETKLLAILSVLKRTLEMEDLSRVLIKTDSKFITSSFNEFVLNWKKNNWKVSSGEPVSNLELWKEIDTTRHLLEEKNIAIELVLIEDKVGSFGNGLVNLYASIGSNSAKEHTVTDTGKTRVVLDQVSDYKTYKESFNERDIVYNYNHLLFGSNELGDLNQCFLTTANNITSIGKRDLSSLFSVNIGYVPDVINHIKAKYRSVVKGHSRVVFIRLPSLTDKAILRLTKYIGIEDLMVTKNNGYETYFSIVGETTPFVFSDNVNLPFIMSSNKLFTRTLDIHRVLQQSTLLDPIDITNRIVKDGKLIITNMDKFLDFDSSVIKKNLKQVFRLALGFDLPSYLSLKSIEADINKVELVLEEDESNFVTSYVKINTKEQTIYSVNIGNKFLKYSN